MNKKNEAKLKSVRGDEKTADEWVDLARGTEDNEKRVRYCSNALKLDPQNEDAWCGKGISLAGLEKYEEAIKCFDKALEIDPKNGDIWQMKGLSLAELEKYEEAIKCYDKALELGTKLEGNAWREKGVCFSSSEVRKYEEAIKCFDKALEIDPNDKLSKKAKKYAEQASANFSKSDTKTPSKGSSGSESLLHWSIAAIWFVSMVMLGSTEIIDAFIGSILLWSWVGYLIIFSPWCRNVFLGTLRFSIRFFSEIFKVGVETFWCEITRQTRHEAFPKKYPGKGEIYKAYIVDSPHDADMMVIVEDRLYNADIKVYLVDTQYDAQIKIYIVDSYSEADKKVYITDSL